MKKAILPSVLLCIFFEPAIAQYPTSFQWVPASSQPKEDQKLQGPCSIFACVAAEEAWFQILYGYASGFSLSQQHIGSACIYKNVTLDPGINSNVAFMQTNGIVTSNTVWWGDPNTDTENGVPYFANLISGSACADPEGAADLYHIAGYTDLSSTFTTLYPKINNTINKLQREIINNGPVIISMTDRTGVFHCGANHSYVIFGWTGYSPNGNSGTISWLLRDSWPASDPCQVPQGSPAVTNYNYDIIANLNSLNLTLQGAGIIVPTYNSNGTIANEGVYEVNASNGSTVVNPLVPVTGLSTGVTPAISMTPTTPYISDKAPITASINPAYLALLDSSFYTIQWVWTPDPHSTATVEFGSPTSASTTVTGGLAGYGRLSAVITRKNGLAEVTYTKDSLYVCAGIPVNIQQNYDFCSGTTRAVQWQIISRSKYPLPSDLEISWNPSFSNPAPSVYYQTSDFPNDMITLEWYNLTSPTSYALRPTFTDPGYGNITDQLTQGAYEMACNRGATATAPLMQGQGDLDSLQSAAQKTVRVYPNPATGRVNISLPPDKSYDLRILTIFGTEVLYRRASGSFSVDLGGYSKGIYVLEFLSPDMSDMPIIQKLILQ